MPQKGRKCEICELKYLEGQTHGFPVNMDQQGNVTVLCPAAENNDKKATLDDLIAKLKKSKKIKT